MTDILNKEYLMSKGAIEEVIDRLTLIYDILTNLSCESPGSLKVRKTLLSECSKQLNVLRSILNLRIIPAGKVIEQNTNKRREQLKYLQSLNLESGKCKYVDMLLNQLKGFGMTTEMAASLEEALVQTGITLDNFHNATNWKALSKLIEENRGNFTNDETVAFEKAVSLLKRCFEHKLEEQARGGYESETEKALQEDILIQTETKSYRKDIITAYLKKFHKIYEDFTVEIHKIAPLLGDKIAVQNPAVTVLYESFTTFAVTDSRVKELAYIKFYQDNNSFQTRKLYLEHLANLSEATKGGDFWYICLINFCYRKSLRIYQIKLIINTVHFL